MADKTLRIIFNGITTLFPGPPRKGAATVDKAFVMMAANQDQHGKRGEQTNEWGTVLPKHYPFVRVARRALVAPPRPDETAFATAGRREHWIYFFEDARVVIRPEPARETRVEYFIDARRPLAERPGSDDVAPPHDMRWLADIRDLFSQPVPLKETANPDQQYVGEEVAAVVDLDGGLLKANFPCASVSPQTFSSAKTDQVVPNLRRVLADEFFIDIPYAASTDEITLAFQPLRENARPAAPERLVLRWPHQETLLVVRMGNDMKAEVRRLDTRERCDPVRLTGPILKPRDEDFDLHYNLLKIPKDAGRLLPQNDIKQCDFQGCKPLLVGGGG